MKKTKLKPFIEVMRINQWIKNLILFTPLFSLGIFEVSKILFLSKIFVGFSLLVSSTYILNDLIDVQSDMEHPEKYKRPVASNIFPIIYWKIFALNLFFLGNLLLYFLNKEALLISTIYAAISISYTFYLKYLKFTDILAIPILFILRVFIGAVTFKIEPSFYLLTFIFSVSFGIACSKKYSILTNVDIKKSKVKDVLKKNYSVKFLINLIYISFNTGLLTYLSWIYFEKFNKIDSIKFIFLVISFLLLIIFTNSFIKHTKLGKSEDFLSLLLKSKVMFFLSLSFIISSVFGLS